MSEPRTPYRLVLTTADTDALARRIAETLVERRLAACVNIVGPMRSVYRWRDGINIDDERLLLIKTRDDRFEAVREAIRELHTYEVPEVVGLAIEAGDEHYLRWLAESVDG